MAKGKLLSALKEMIQKSTLDHGMKSESEIAHFC